MIDDEASAVAWLHARHDCPAETIARLEQLVVLLNSANRTQNLISAASEQSIWQRHIADSAQLCDYLPPSFPTLLDLGSGAGFPGLVIALLRPATVVHLVESRPLRISWLQHAVSSLGIANVVVHGERVAKLPQMRYAAITARAFAPLARLLDEAARFSTSETLWALPKGRSAIQELAGLRGWTHMFHVEQSRTDPDAGIIVGTLLRQPRASR